MISLTINGRGRQLPSPMPLPRFLEESDIDPKIVAVAVNGEVIPKARYDTVTLHDGDVVEIVRMVGGG